jgi:sterol desaturase/sphingolipid hydroxylase (fatty acid hydroxylase superfamily)
VLKNIVLIGIVTFLLFLERLIPFFQFKPNKLIKDYGLNFGVGILNALISSLTIGLLFGWVFAIPLESSLFLNTSFPYWLQILVTFICLDIYIYWWHRLVHTKIGWWLHKFHHQDTTMNVSTAFRFHTLEVVVSNLPRVLIVYALGAPPEVFLAYEIIFTIQNSIQHSNITFPKWLEKVASKILITPSLHKIHHSKLVDETNSNYSTIFSFWDRLFGSYKQRDFEDYKRIKFGI